MTYSNQPYNARAVTVGTSEVELFVDKTNTERSVLVITNTSTTNQKITLGLGYVPTSGVGLVLYPGTTYIEVQDVKFSPTASRITAIADAANGSVACYERSA